MKQNKPNIVHPGQQVMASVLALGAAYLFASLAIDRGNLAYYALAFVGIYIGVKYLFRAVKGIKHGNN